MWLSNSYGGSFEDRYILQQQREFAYSMDIDEFICGDKGFSGFETLNILTTSKKRNFFDKN